MLGYPSRTGTRHSLHDKTFLIAVQNDIGPEHVHCLGPLTGIFVGADTVWKLATMAIWARLADAHGAICHVGRVNSLRRSRRYAAAGVDSFGRSGVSRFATARPPLDAARRQANLESWIEARAMRAERAD